MDKRIAAIAITLIVAAPILIGYLMAYEDVERVRYNDDSTKNVTDLLINDAKYSYMSANTFSVNSRVFTEASITMNPDLTTYNTVYPAYRDISGTYSAIAMGLSTTPPVSFSKGVYSYYEFTVDSPTSSSNYFSATVHGGNLDGQTYSTVIGLKYYDDNQYIWPRMFLYNYNTNTYSYADIRAADYVSFDSSHYTGATTVRYVYATGTAPQYANFAAGYNAYWNSRLDGVIFDSAEWLPGFHTSNVIATVDLNDLTAYTNGSFVDHVGYRISAWAYGDALNEYYTLAKMDVQQIGGVWKINDVPIMRSDDPTKNVWQFSITPGNITANYVGSWPSAVGPAYAYQSISVPFESEAPDKDIQSITFTKSYPTDTERMRIDAATARSTEYPIIKDQTYSPTMLNGSSDGYETKLSKFTAIGDSITFAGNTYEIEKGKIRIGSTKVSMDGLELRSEKQSDNTFVNYIGGKEIPGTTPAVPDITFNGSWSMIVQTTYMTSETVTSTEWIPGEFAWNGVDSSFALMGLITCAAAFVGLGMYGKRSGAKVGTLMLVCGCAAFVFLALL